MWGSGSNDESTIPSHYSKLTGHPVVNFGESGYTARQNLNMALNAFLDNTLEVPKWVVYYDGGNEVTVKCQKILTPVSSSREFQIRNALLEVRAGALEFEYLLRSPMAFFTKWKNKVRSKLGLGGYVSESDDYYDCDINPVKSRLVAEALINDWSSARSMLKSRGIKFFPVLQPIMYFSKSKMDHFTPEILIGSEALERQYMAVYPMIRKVAREQGFEFYDFTEVLDVEEAFFFDHVHISHTGNKRVAEAMVASFRANTP